MADRIVVLSAGRIEQLGSPLELYHRPNNLFVAGFIGSPKMNFLQTKASRHGDGGIEVKLPGGSSIRLDARGTAAADGAPVTLGVRPEHIEIVSDGEASLTGEIRLAERLGSETMFYLQASGGEEIAVKADGLASGKVGERLALRIPANACHLFDSSGKAIVNGDLTR